MFAFIFDNVSFGEWTLLIVVFLIVMGPRKIPQTARTLGNYYSKLRRAADAFKRQLMDLETEFNKAATEAESEVKEVENAFASEGDESDVIPPSDAYYPSEANFEGESASDASSNGDDSSDPAQEGDIAKASTEPEKDSGLNTDSVTQA